MNALNHTIQRNRETIEYIRIKLQEDKDLTPERKQHLINTKERLEREIENALLTLKK